MWIRLPDSGRMMSKTHGEQYGEETSENGK